MSWSREPSTWGSEGSYTATTRMCLREPRLGEPLHVVEHRMDVETFARRRAFVGEGLHAVDELDDPVGLLADQPRQGAVLVADGGFQQLRGAANAATAGS